jgi:hypothetical protein
LDIDERMKRMTKEEAVAMAICGETLTDAGYVGDYHAEQLGKIWDTYLPEARAAIAAADKWDAEVHPPTPELISAVVSELEHYKPGPVAHISPGLDSAIQEELGHGPKSIVGDGQ